MVVRRCPPGVFCIENVSMTVLAILFTLVLVYFFMNAPASSSSSSSSDNHRVIHLHADSHPSMFQSRPNYGVSNAQEDVLLNPYVPPLRNDSALDIRGPVVVPINVSTQGTPNSTYRQVGILTRINGPETILPLMGRPLFRNRDKWQFYTISEKSNFIKLPISVKGRSCTNEYGCDNVYNGDTVYVEGYNDAFKVTAYDNNVMQYLPF
jgi:hypothetical protein